MIDPGSIAPKYKPNDPSGSKSRGEAGAPGSETARDRPTDVYGREISRISTMFRMIGRKSSRSITTGGPEHTEAGRGTIWRFPRSELLGDGAAVPGRSSRAPGDRATGRRISIVTHRQARGVIDCTRDVATLLSIRSGFIMITYRRSTKLHAIRKCALEKPIATKRPFLWK